MASAIDLLRRGESESSRIRTRSSLRRDICCRAAFRKSYSIREILLERFPRKEHLSRLPHPLCPDFTVRRTNALTTPSVTRPRSLARPKTRSSLARGTLQPTAATHTFSFQRRHPSFVRLSESCVSAHSDAGAVSRSHRASAGRVITGELVRLAPAPRDQTSDVPSPRSRHARSVPSPRPSLPSPVPSVTRPPLHSGQDAFHRQTPRRERVNRRLRHRLLSHTPPVSTTSRSSLGSRMEEHCSTRATEPGAVCRLLQHDTTREHTRELRSLATQRAQGTLAPKNERDEGNLTRSSNSADGPRCPPPASVVVTMRPTWLGIGATQTHPAT